MQIQLFDTTLRDGTQSEGLSLSVEDKLRIARVLDGFGIQYIEGGYPGSNPKDIEFFRRARGELRLKHAKLTAFGSTRKATPRPPRIRTFERWWNRARPWCASTASPGPCT
jgi:2-isopropylmalate synthase